jgi:hypothetical protein
MVLVNVRNMRELCTVGSKGNMLFFFLGAFFLMVLFIGILFMVYHVAQLGSSDKTGNV